LFDYFLSFMISGYETNLRQRNLDFVCKSLYHALACGEINFAAHILERRSGHELNQHIRAQASEKLKSLVVLSHFPSMQSEELNRESMPVTATDFVVLFCIVRMALVALLKRQMTA
jgi:hypothetical protein